MSGPGYGAPADRSGMPGADPYIPNIVQDLLMGKNEWKNILNSSELIRIVTIGRRI